MRIDLNTFWMNLIIFLLITVLFYIKFFELWLWLLNKRLVFWSFVLSMLYFNHLAIRKEKPEIINVEKRNVRKNRIQIILFLISTRHVQKEAISNVVEKTLKRTILSFCGHIVVSCNIIMLVWIDSCSMLQVLFIISVPILQKAIT